MRQGQRGVSEWPVPGASKAIVAMPVSALRRGRHISRFAPIPPMSSRGRPSPATVETRSRRSPAQMKRTSTRDSGGVDVATGGRIAGLVLAAAELRRSLLLLAGALDRPLGPVLPPGAGVLGRRRAPLGRVRAGLRTEEHPSLRVARGVHEA